MSKSHRTKYIAAALFQDDELMGGEILVFSGRGMVMVTKGALDKFAVIMSPADDRRGTSKGCIAQ